MKRQTFFEKFDLFAGAPGAVAKMRELVRHLAVTGTLIDQDDNDEPALVLLDRIAAHKKALAKEGKLRGPTAVSPMSPDEVPRLLPSSWTWVRFGEIMVNRDGERIPVSKEERATKAKTYDYYGASGIIDKIDGYLFDKPLLLIGEDGANLINRSTPIAFMARGQYWVNNHAHVLDGISEDFLRYIELHINAINLETYVTGSAQPKMNQAKMNSIPIALPPLAEQKRIVAKVDELMALCDRLEAQQQDRETRHAALARASLARFAEAPTPANLHFLFHPSYAIPPADLRKSILTLAFAGKLVPQDPGDEPASVLLERARAEKARLIKEGVVKKEPWAHKLEDATTLYDLPPGWEWTHVSDVVEKVTVGFVGSMKEEYRQTGVPFLRCQNVRVNRYEPVGLTFVSPEFHRSINKSTLRPGDVVVTRSGNVGVTCVIPESLPEANCSDLVIVKRPIAIIPAFLSYFINSIAGRQIEAKTVGIALTHFNTQSVAQMSVALPPLAEQRRIVAKVEQLMALVDRLEAQLAGSRESAGKLLEALVAELSNSDPEIRS